MTEVRHSGAAQTALLDDIPQANTSWVNKRTGDPARILYVEQRRKLDVTYIHNGVVREVPLDTFTKFHSPPAQTPPEVTLWPPRKR